MQSSVNHSDRNTRFRQNETRGVGRGEQRSATHGTGCLEVLVHEVQAAFADMVAARQLGEGVGCVPADSAFIRLRGVFFGCDEGCGALEGCVAWEV